MEIPDAMLNTQVRQMLDDFSRRMQSQGLTMEQYFQFTGMTLEKMQEEMKPQALKRIQTRLVLEKIAEVENIQPTDEEVEEEFKKMADAYKMEVEKIKELLGDREFEQMKKEFPTEEEIFQPQQLQFKVKKERPATPKQKKYLENLMKYHAIGECLDIDQMLSLIHI